MSPHDVKHEPTLSPGLFEDAGCLAPVCAGSGGTALIDGPSSSYPRVGYRMSLCSMGLSSL